MTARKPRAKRSMFEVGSENWICKELMIWVRLNTTRYPWLARMYHTPNEGKRNPLKAHAMGIKAGVSDYHCPAPHICLPSLWLEVKAGKNRLTEAQKCWLDEMQSAGNWASCWNSLQGCINYTTIWCEMIAEKTKEMAK